MSEKKRLFIFGFGYSAAALAQSLMEQGWDVAATSRHSSKRREMERLGIKAYDFPDKRLPRDLKQYTHLLCSIAPIKLGDTVLQRYGEIIAQQQWEWIGYLSTTGVYGDHRGEWVDETTRVKGDNERIKSRVVAERKWMNLYEEHQQPLHLFRLAGIYGPGRGIVSRLCKGVEVLPYKEGQFFSRIHVRDIVRALQASMAQPQAGTIYNLCDDLPAPSHEVAQFAAKAMGLDIPPLVDWQEAGLSEMAKEFYNNNRRVKNERIKQLLPKGEWLYPSYKQGIMADIKALGLGEREDG